MATLNITDIAGKQKGSLSGMQNFVEVIIEAQTKIPESFHSCVLA